MQLGVFTERQRGVRGLRSRSRSARPMRLAVLAVALVLVGLSSAPAGADGVAATERVSVDSSGGQANAPSFRSAISADGRFVAFESNASNHVYVRDRQNVTLARVSVDSFGNQGNSASGTQHGAAISADGRYVAFSSHASNLVAGDTNGTWDVFVHDRQSGMTERVNVDS